jgi:hypothetical protein
MTKRLGDKDLSEADSARRKAVASSASSMSKRIIFCAQNKGIFM